MSSTPVTKIKNLIKHLPKRDIKIAESYIEKRDFESLKEIVDSDIFKVKKSLNSSNPKEEYLKINTLALNLLKNEIDSYLVLLGIPEDEVYQEEDFGEFISDIPYNFNEN